MHELGWVYEGQCEDTTALLNPRIRAGMRLSPPSFLCLSQE